MKNTQRSHGFTLVELLVVIAIIGLLVAILLPAVQAARASARRLHCKNNLKQLAIAVANYESANDAYPASGIVDEYTENILGRPGRFNPKAGKMFSWVVQILPQLEEGALFDQFDLEKTVLKQALDPQSVHLSSLMCPSDEAFGRFFEFRDPPTDSRFGFGGVRFAKGNYAAYVGPDHVEIQNRYPGALVGPKPNKAYKLRDGMSKIILLAEILTRPHERDQRGAWALPWVGSSLLAYDMHHINFYIEARETYQPDVETAPVAQPPNNQGPNLDVLYECPDPAGAQLFGMPCQEWTPPPETFLSAAPRSHHPGGVFVVFVDGHVGFLLNEIDRVAMALLISSDDGQTVESARHIR